MRLDEAARGLLGVPFRHQGRNPAIGIDCIGLIVVAGLRAGLAFPAFDSTAYSEDPALGLLEAHLSAALGTPVAKDSLQAGDIVSIDYKGETRHVGIVAEHPHGLSLIHTNMAVGEVTEARINEKWLRRIVGVYRP